MKGVKRVKEKYDLLFNLIYFYYCFIKENNLFKITCVYKVDRHCTENIRNKDLEKIDRL
jgi:hypothetical protein